MSEQAKPIQDIITEAKAMIAEDDSRLSGMTRHEGMLFFNDPALRVQRVRDNRAALVAEVERLRKRYEASAP